MTMTTYGINNNVPKYVNLGWVEKILRKVPSSGLRPEELEFLDAWGNDSYMLERGRCRTMVFKLDYARLLRFERMYLKE